MKEALFILAAFLLVLTACSSNTIQIGEEQQTEPTAQNNAVQKPQEVNVNLTPEFKVTSQKAIRNPPSISGTVLNKGLGAGTVNVIARVHYAGVVAEEKQQELTIKSQEEANFSMMFDKTTQWTSYSVILE